MVGRYGSQVTQFPHRAKGEITMKWTCKCCRKNIERKTDMYSNPYLLDPLWLHMKEQHKEIYEQMMDFENPYDVMDLYTNNEEI